MKTRTAASLLRSAADKFEQLQCYLHDTIYEATGLGLFVDDTGRVSPGRLEPTERNDPDTELFRRREAENARIYSDLIVTIVAEATEVDERIATALRELSPGFPGAEWEYNNARDGARNVAAILGLNEAGIPPPGKDPANVHAWWNGLSADQRQVYLTAYPDRLGALDGLPAVDRDYANQLALRAYIGKNVNYRDDVGNDQHDTALMLLNKLEASESAPPDKRLYLLSLYPLGDGKAAVSIGNPDTADHTAVLIPGVGTELSGIRGLISRANALHEAATPRGTADPSVAVVAWLGYDTPSVDVDIVTAPFGGKAEDGALALDSFVNGLHAAHDGNPTHLTVIGHSYGSTVIGEAASNGDGLRADDMIAVGSPGMRVDNAGELNIDTHHVWAGAASDDTFVARPEENTRWLTHVPLVGNLWAGGIDAIHGPAPHNPDFGGNVLTVDTSGHSDYWKPGSVILKSQAAGHPRRLRWRRTRTRRGALTMHHHTLKPWRYTAAALTLAVTMAGCATNPFSKEEPLQTKPQSEVLQLVETRAKTITDTAGSPFDRWSIHTMPCDGPGGTISDDGPWSMAGIGSFKVAAADQLATLSRIRDILRQQGYEITGDRTFSDGTRGSLSARDPKTEFTMTLTTTEDLGYVSVIIGSDCYLPAAGEDPANA